jgi:outer membrane protein OmpA-like peptidoglycan-associated protein
MTSAIARALAVAALATLGASCVTQTGTVVLLPEKDGKDTAVVVKQRDGQVVLSMPYTAAKLTTAAPEAYPSTPQEVQAVFGAALAAQPSRPTQFTLYFVEGKDELTDESKQIVNEVFAEIAKRPVPDVLVIGHTDSVGTQQANDALSRQRAEVIRTGLIQNGIAPENIVAVGRGKREPFVLTAEGVAHPRNRRVEITVR